MKSEPRQISSDMTVETRNSAETPVWKMRPTRNTVGFVGTLHPDPAKHQYADIEDVAILGEN